MNEIKNKIEQAVVWMEKMVDNPSVGYDQSRRWGPDYDCSSMVISAWEWADVPVKQNGATYTGNMYTVFLACGFEDVSEGINFSTGAGLQRGDVLLNHQRHTAMYIGNGQTAEASINELGTVTGGETGDQTGREVLRRAYRNYPWDCVLRYTGNVTVGGAQQGTEGGGKAPTYFYTLKLPLLKIGMQSAYVVPLCYMLAARGYDPGEPGAIYTEKIAAAVTALQNDTGLTVDGESGGEVWGELLGGV